MEPYQYCCNVATLERSHTAPIPLVKKLQSVVSFDDGGRGGGRGGWWRGIRGRNDAFLLDPADHLDYSDFCQAEDPRW